MTSPDEAGSETRARPRVAYTCGGNWLLRVDFNRSCELGSAVGDNQANAFSKPSGGTKVVLFDDAESQDQMYEISLKR
jgi:hypothetical protein